MSFSIDANVLLYASNQESAHWETATQILTECATKKEVFYLPWPAIMAYLRISTHPAIFSAPLTPGEAAGNVSSLLQIPHARVLSEGPRFWETYRQTAKTVVARGNLVPDAHIAALLLEHGVNSILTNDTDFLKFPFLKVINPFG